MPALERAAARHREFSSRLYTQQEPYSLGVTPPLQWRLSTLQEFELSERLVAELRQRDCFESDEGMSTRCVFWTFN